MQSIRNDGPYWGKGYVLGMDQLCPLAFSAYQKCCWPDSNKQILCLSLNAAVDVDV